MKTAIYLETYGCQMNVRDSQLIAGLLAEAGGRLVTAPEEADVILINTCAVREKAEERVIGRINQLARLRRRRPVRIGVLGCMAQHRRQTLLEILPVLDFIIGPDAYRSLPETVLAPAGEPRILCQPDRRELYEGLPACRPPGAVSAFVTIMRGCDRRCTFCIVPDTRGRERSRSWPGIVREVEELRGQGVREVTLLGQTVNAWTDEGMTFGELLWRVAGTGIERIRFTSPHPLFFGGDELDALARCPAVCEAVHLPMQSGSTRILRRMNRGYTCNRFLEIAAQIRTEVPGVTLGTDLIVGFPGETEEDFADTLGAMEACAFDTSFHFKYSPRPGTPAARRIDDDVPAEVKQERLERVMALQKELTARSQQAVIGRTGEVLIDGRGGRGEDQWTGRTRDDRTVVLTSGHDLAGRMVTAVITGAGTWTLRGRLTGQVPG